MESKKDYLILTNNPLTEVCIPPEYCVEFHDGTARDILIAVRDRIFLGHRLFTHPLSGSIKPNESPYKSVVISRRPQRMEPEEAEIISDSIAVFDKFPPCGRKLSEQVMADFQLIDYSLLCSGLNLDAAAGLSRKRI